MRMFDTTPLLRSAVGFDNLVRMLDNVSRADHGGTGYPPYNIEKLNEDDYRITMAVAGFEPEELDVTVKDDVLVISGRSFDQTVETEEESGRVFLHRGIAKRAFERRFHLADTIKVVGASVENGLLHVELEREIPEERKPRQIEIKTPAGTQKVIDQKSVN